MADTFWSVVKGEQNHDQVTTGASTSGEAIELRVVTASGMTKLEILNGLKAIENYIVHAGNDAPA